jgi:hypothetical protein
MRSTSTNGYWVGIWRTSRPISPELSAGAPASARCRLRLGCGGRGRGRRRGGGLRLLRLVRLADHVARDVEVAVDRVRHLRVEHQVEALVLRHLLDDRPHLLLELGVDRLRLLLRALAHAVDLGLAVLEVGLALARLAHDVRLLLVARLGAQHRALLLELLLQRLERGVELAEVGLLLGRLGVDVVLELLELARVALAEQALGRDARHVDHGDAGRARRIL